MLSHIHDNKDIMNRVKKYRVEKKMSQSPLAKEINIARQTINLIENNKYNPSLDLCTRLATVLETDLNRLF